MLNAELSDPATFKATNIKFKATHSLKHLSIKGKLIFFVQFSLQIDKSPETRPFK